MPDTFWRGVVGVIPLTSSATLPNGLATIYAARLTRRVSAGIPRPQDSPIRIHDQQFNRLRVDSSSDHLSPQSLNLIEGFRSGGVFAHEGGLLRLVPSPWLDDTEHHQSILPMQMVPTVNWTRGLF